MMIWKIAALAWAGMSVSVAAVAQSNTVWRVGTFDGSSGEFAEGEPHGQVVFQAGQDDPKKSWYSYAPVAFAG